MRSLHRIVGAWTITLAASSVIPAADCNENGVPDLADISDGTSADCNANTIPDECDIARVHFGFAGTQEFRFASSITVEDFDGDGDLDIATAHFNSGHIKVYRNELNDKNWLAVRCRGTKSNSSGIGARVSIYPAGHAGEAAKRLAWREIHTTRGYCTSTPALAHFGLDAEHRYDVVVIFPGSSSPVTNKNVRTGRILKISEE